MIPDGRLADGEVRALLDQIASVVDAERAKVRDPPDLREEQVVRVVDDPLHVGLSESHALAVRK